MSYLRKELYFLKDFDFTIIQPNRKNAEVQDKFLLVLDVINHDKGMYCLVTSLSSKASSLIVPKLTDGCTSLDDSHFFKFDGNDICHAFTFDVQSYIRGTPSDVFEESIVTLYQKFNMAGKSQNKGFLKDEVFISVLECLTKSSFLERNFKAHLKTIIEQEKGKLSAKK